MNRVGLITGASRGLGRALALALAGRGWSLVVDARGEAALTQVAEELRSAALDPAGGGGSEHIRALSGDVADPEHRRRMAEAVSDLGGLDALVHNASLLGPSPQPTLRDYPLDVLEQVYRVNVFAPLALTQTLLPLLRPRARILAITSDAAREPYEGWGGYGSSKAALEQLANILAAEHSELRVYRIDPGDMRTQMHQEAFPGEDISDRAAPEDRVPGLLRLLEEDLPSGRYEAEILAAEAAGVR